MRLSRKSHPSRAGLSLIEIAIVVAVLGVMALIALPNLFSSRKTAEEKVCISNLRAIKHAKEKWGFNEKKQPSDIPTFDDIKEYLSRVDELSICPLGGKYSLGALNETPTCEYASQGHELPE